MFSESLIEQKKSFKSGFKNRQRITDENGEPFVAASSRQTVLKTGMDVA